MHSVVSHACISCTRGIQLLHLLRGADADDGEGHGDHAAHAVGQQKSCLQHAGLRALDAAAGVETVEAGGQLRDVLVDAAGIVVPGGQADLLRQGGQLLDELPLGLVAEQGGVDLTRLGHRVPLGGQGREQRADARVGVLDVVDGVLVVLPLSQLQVEEHRGVGPGVEEVAG